MQATLLSPLNISIWLQSGFKDRYTWVSKFQVRASVGSRPIRVVAKGWIRSEGSFGILGLGF